MKKSKRQKLLGFVGCLIATFALVVLPAIYAQAEQKTEEEKAWEAYVEAVRVDENAIIRMRLDDQMMADYGLYYKADYSTSFYLNKTLEEQVNDGVLEELEESVEYPGCFLISNSYKDVDTGYVVGGQFFLYKPGETDSSKYIESFYNSDVCLGSDDIATLDYYTVSFEQGDIEVMELPKPFIHKKGSFNDLYNIKVDSLCPAYLGNGVVEAGGYALSCYADKNKVNIKSDSGYSLTAPVTLHPVFVNEQDVVEGRDIGQYIYSTWNSNEKIVVTTAEEFLKAVVVKNRESHFVIVRGDVSLDASKCKEICDAEGISYNKYYMEYYGILRIVAEHNYEGNDFVIIEEGATLTMDGVQLECAVNWEGSLDDMRITVQDGGKLALKNKSKLEYAGIAVQTKGAITVDGTSDLNCDSLFNHGSITFEDRESFNKQTDYSYIQSLEVYQTFFNSKSGVITADFGVFDFDLEYSMWDVPSEYRKGNLGVMSYVPLRNNGTMTFSNNCKLVFGGSNSVYQHDRCAQMPFINNGVINVKSIDSENTLYSKSSAMTIEYGSFVNNGTLNLENKNGKYPFSGSSFSSSGTGIYVYEGEFVNNGKLNLDVHSGIGMYVYRLYFDPAGCSNSNKSVDTIQPGRLNNSANGEINITTANESVGLVFGESVEFNNQGKVLLEYQPEEKTKLNMSILVLDYYQTSKNPHFNNAGLVTNNAYIGYEKPDNLVWNGSSWSGSGKDGACLVAAEEPKYDTKWSSNETYHWHECLTGGESKDYEKHTLKTTTTKATPTTDGKKVTKCTVCGRVTKTEVIYAAKNISLSASAYTYDGKVKKPSVTVKNSKGKVIDKANYDIKYPTDMKAVGKYTVKITFKGNSYSGDKSLSYVINPPKTSILSLTAGKKSFALKWAKKTKEVTGYEIQYSTSDKFKTGNKTVKISKSGTTQKTVKKLTGGKKYYVRIRTYKTLNKTTYYSDWSAKKAVTAKK